MRYTINKALREELAALRVALPPSDRGYHALTGASLPLLLADLGAVAEYEDDDLLRWFAGRRIHTLAAQRWVRQHQGARSDDMDTNATPDLEGYDEWVAQYVATLAPEQLAHTLAGLDPAQRLAGLDPAQRLAGLDPAQRLAGLDPAQRLAGLDPAQRLAGLDPAQRLAGLSEAEQVLAFPDHLLRFLPDAYLATLPEPVQSAIRARRAR